MRACVARLDRPQTNREPAEIARKRTLMQAERIRPLSAFVDALRAEHPHAWIPYVDPTEAGVEARILRLMEAPGPGAVAERGGSGFVSADNDDPSALNSWTLLREAGIDRCHELISWNAVPWYVGTPTRIAHPSVADIRNALPALVRFLDLLPHLRVVVLLGRKSQRAWGIALREMPSLMRLKSLEAPHHSPLSLNGRPERRQQIVDAFREARAIAAAAD
ncbi:MAG TPA: uracil-DNA glycosylase [Dehalococcoidia bacterium]|nr:uracil-DNA glycosylase [Dehalococcoidia bacterium]